MGVAVIFKYSFIMFIKCCISRKDSGLCVFGCPIAFLCLTGAQGRKGRYDVILRSGYGRLELWEIIILLI